jgi:NADPH-dependent glutamate synthase beta subunit-like oxidoreductase
VAINGKTLEEAGCLFCGACVEVCPTGSIRDQEGIFDFEKPRHDALVPCRDGCPAHVDVPRYIRFVKEKNYAAASAVVREKVVFAEMLGYICSHNCERYCKRRFLNTAVSICQIKRFACSKSDDEWKKKITKKHKTGRNIAVIGSGPAGMTAAYYLQKCGHGVTIFEKEREVGGTPRYGIPEYRLPRNIIEKEADIIRELGVVIKTNSLINSPADLLRQSFEAVLVAIGTGKGVKLPIEGNDAEGVLINVEFLKAVSKHEKISLGEEIIVLGGGNVACDCAGVAMRLGARKVHMACLESRETMPASPEEIEAIKREGVVLHPAVTFNKILSENGRVTGLNVSKVRSFKFDENRRVVIEKEEDSEYFIKADTLIFAVGQNPEIPENFGLETGRGNFIVTDKSGATGVQGVFAAGDAVTGTSSVVQAIAKAREMAKTIDLYLGGDGVIDEVLASVGIPSGRLEGVKNIAELEKGIPNYSEKNDLYTVFDLGFDKNCVNTETERCLQCDLRLQLEPQKFWNNYRFT